MNLNLRWEFEIKTQIDVAAVEFMAIRKVQRSLKSAYFFLKRIESIQGFQVFEIAKLGIHR
jgi:hypothetical protein